MTDKILLKLFILLFVSSLVTATVVSCRPMPPEDVKPTRRPTYDVQVYGDLRAVDPRDQVVVFWYPYTGRQEALLLAMIDEFNGSNEWGVAIVGDSRVAVVRDTEKNSLLQLAEGMQHGDWTLEAVTASTVRFRSSFLPAK